MIVVGGNDVQVLDVFVDELVELALAKDVIVLMISDGGSGFLALSWIRW